MTHQMPLLHSGTQRNHKEFSSDAPSKCRFGVASDAKLFWKIMVVVVFGQGAAKGVRQKEFDHFFLVFGTLSVTFWSLLSSLFCQTPFAGLLLQQGEIWAVPEKLNFSSEIEVGVCFSCFNVSSSFLSFAFLP